MPLPDSYKTIDKGQESLYKSKGSKFLAYCFRVVNEAEIKHHLDAMRQKYPDASHYCYAYVLGIDKTVHRANDDGEPTGTAGQPILRQIQKSDLTNILVVVVRYFGGTKLGVRGLIEAYGAAASECLGKCTISTHLVREKFEIFCPFGMENEVYKVCKQLKLDITTGENQQCFYAELRIPLQDIETFKNKLKEFYQISIKSIGIE